MNGLVGVKLLDVEYICMSSEKGRGGGGVGEMEVFAVQLVKIGNDIASVDGTNRYSR